MSERRSATAVVRGTRFLVAAAGAAAVLGFSVQPAPAAVEPTLLGQWRFDERDGQVAVDDGPHRLDGRLGATDALEAADPVRIEGASGRALRFEGAAFVSLPDTDALAVQSLTAETVVRAPASPGPWRYLISRGSQRCLAGSYGLYTGSAGGVAIYVFDGARYVVSATARPADVWDGAWHHVAGTFDGVALRLFVDGRPVGELMDAPLRIDHVGTSAHAAFGRYVGDCELGFRGDMDLVRLWSGALAPEALDPDALDPNALTEAAEGSAKPISPAGRLPAAAPGTVIPAGSNSSPPAPSRPPARACVVRLLRASTSARRRTVLRVRLTVGRRPLRAARVVARQSGQRKVLARARTNASGRAQLVLAAPRSRRMWISTQGRRRCAPVQLRLPRS